MVEEPEDDQKPPGAEIYGNGSEKLGFSYGEAKAVARDRRRWRSLLGPLTPTVNRNTKY